jgi:hypothetical protein
MTCGSIIQGHIRPFRKKHCVLGAGARLCAKQDVSSKNSIVELLHGGVGGAELEKLEQSCPK